MPSSLQGCRVTSPRGLRTSLAGLFVVATLSLAAPAQATIGEPVPDATGAIFNEDAWVSGESTYNYVYGNAYGNTRIHAPKAVPTAGEVFYLHAEATYLYAGGPSNDVAGMTLNLPSGVSVTPTGGTPMRCFITGTRSNNVPTRQTGDCPASPSPNTGVQIPIGAFTLFYGGINVGGEKVHVFVPVTANRAIAGESVSISTSFSDPSATPRDLVGNAPLTVEPGSPAPDPNPSPVVLSKPGGKAFKWVAKGKAKLTWKAVPGAAAYQLRLTSGKKTSKWQAVAVNKATLVKLKPGKKYVLQVRAVSASGDRGPIAKWRFRAK